MGGSVCPEAGKMRRIEMIMDLDWNVHELKQVSHKYGLDHNIQIGYRTTTFAWVTLDQPMAISHAHWPRPCGIRHHHPCY